MKIKKYRAASMREALEQVKLEMGDDALVLDTRRVKAGGFLGVGAREVVEISVDAGSAPADKGKRHTPHRSSTILNLTEDSPAVTMRQPPPEAATERPATTLFASAFAAREAYQNNGHDAFEPNPKSLEAGVNRQRPASNAPQGIELAETAPRIVHPPRPNNTTSATGIAPAAPPPALPRAAATTTLPAAAEPASPAQPEVHQPSELERLRAEVREMKLSLSSLYNRPLTFAGAKPEAQPEVNLGADSALYDSPYYEAYLELNASGLSPDFARRAILSTVPQGGPAPEFRSLAQIKLEGLANLLRETVRFENSETQTASAVVFVGPTGVGKTTTIAKLAARAALREHRRVELVTLDTFRIGAVEQLRTYAEIIGAGCHVVRSTIELEALTRRLPADALVLIDTAGRSPHDLADQMDLADYLRVNEELIKCLTLPATTHASDALAAVSKFALYGVNRLALTKIDETTRPGSLANLAASAQMPLLYLCAGQRVPEDFERATAEAFAARILRSTTVAPLAASAAA
ncbi:MAG: flagellar biosynthesis protein FlhF [Pyrinomonadaceae bacterium]